MTGRQRIAVLLLLVLGVLPVWQASRIKARPPWPILAGERPLVIADRGGAGRWPENTLLAFQHASNNGFAILVDVRQTADGRLVAMRDASVDRTTDGKGPVAGLSLEDLRALDAAYHFSQDGGQTYPFRGRSVRIPDLMAILRSFPRDRIFLQLHEHGLAETVWDVLEQTGAADRVVVLADNDGVMQEFRAVAKGRVPTAATTAEAKRFAQLVRWRLIAFYQPSFDLLTLPAADAAAGTTPAILHWAARRGIKVHATGVDDPALLAPLVDMKFDGVISERPDLILQALQELGN